MKALRFITRISKSGNIHIPLDKSFYNKEVEIIIKERSGKNAKQLKAVDFVNKWAGFLNTENTDKSKYNYLSEKYK